MWAPMLWLLLFPAADYSAEGMKALEERKYDVAVNLFSQAIAADPDDYSAHFHFALANSLAGKDTEAVASYRKVLELKPGLYEAELNLGILLVGQKQGAEAAKLLESAAEKKPNEFRPFFYLAEAEMQAS